MYYDCVNVKIDISSLRQCIRDKIVTYILIESFLLQNDEKIRKYCAPDHIFTTFTIISIDLETSK